MSKNSSGSYVTQKKNNDKYFAMLSWDNINPSLLSLSTSGLKIAQLLEAKNMSGVDLSKVAELLA